MQKREHVKIEVSNSSVQRKFDPKSKLPQTSKNDPANHGIGLRNVQETVEKNQGIFTCSWKDGVFMATVILQQKVVMPS